MVGLCVERPTHNVLSETIWQQMQNLYLTNKGGLDSLQVCVSSSSHPGKPRLSLRRNSETSKQNSNPNKKNVHTNKQNHNRIIQFPLCPSFFSFSRSFKVYILSKALVPRKAHYTKLNVKAIFIQPSSSDSRYVNWICECH